MMHSHGAFQRIDAPTTRSEIDRLVDRATSMKDMIAHGDDPAMMAEHIAAHALVDRSEATHVAVAHGSWFDPETWASGEVPGAEARVLIPMGIEVTYDGTSRAPLFTVRVDGHLTFATDEDTLMRVDTLFTSHSGHLTIGTAETPVEDGVTADIRFTGGAIDTAWDPMLLSRGMISHGTTTIHGAKTDSHAKVSEAPWAGDTFITLADLPEGWEVGDTIVIAGTRFEGFKWSNDARAHVWHEREDEVREIARIVEARDGVELHLDAPLEHDHHAPRRDLATSVANMDRSITFASENESVHQRGHVMFMHSDDVDVRYAAFHELGRTDKSERAHDFSDLEDVGATANLKGRYPFHFHRTGTEDEKDPAMAVGNAVFGSPGWGFVHHDSHAIFHDNASYDVFGAGYVAETGNETGSWTDNIAIGGTGLNRIVKDGSDVEAFDLGRTGDGFWFQGRLVESTGNVAASVNNGFVYMHRGRDGMIPLEAEAQDFPELFPGSKWIGAADAPIRNFRDNEAFAAKEGLHIVKSNPNQGHDLHSHLERFTAWEVKSGAHIQYSSHYTLEEFDLTGREESLHNASRNGISFGNNASDVAIVGGSITGFDDGAIDFNKNFTGQHTVHPLSAHAFVAVDVAFGRGQTAFETFDARLDRNLEERPDAVAPRLILDGKLRYREGEHDDPGARKVVVEGVKIDSLGRIPIPSGSDSIVFDRNEVRHILETDGWWITPQGKKVFLIEVPITDRLTGEVVKTGHMVEIADNVPLGERWYGYEDAVYRGVIDPGSRAPETRADAAETMAGMDVAIDVLANDSDRDGDPLTIDGVLQPHHGQVFHEADGTLTYRPDMAFSGTDTFEYFAADGQGNFTRETVTVEVDGPGGAQAVLEVGSTRLTHDAVTIELEGDYDRPVVIASLRTEREADPAVVRLLDVSSDSVTLRLIEPENMDGRHRAETVDYIVVEAGSWELADGTRVSAGLEEVTRLGMDGATSFETGLDSEDAVLVHHQESRAPGWGLARLAPEGDDWAVALDVSEAMRGRVESLRVSETAGWVAFDAAEDGSEMFLFRRFEDVGSDGTPITGVARGFDAGTGGPAGGLHGIATAHSADPAFSRADVGSGAPRLRVQEETTRDAETERAGEDIHLLVYSDAALDAVHYGIAL